MACEFIRLVTQNAVSFDNISVLRIPNGLLRGGDSNSDHDGSAAAVEVEVMCSSYHCRKCKGVTIRKETLERLFVDQLQTLKPKAEFMALFRTAVLSLWKQRFAGARQLWTGLEQRLCELESREALLDEAFLYQRQIDSKTYERQRDRVREEITLARIELEDSHLDELDVEGIVGFAEQVLANAARLWMAGTPEQRQRLQLALLPKDFGSGTTGLEPR